MMKRILIFMLPVIMVGLCTGCGASNKSNDSVQAEQESTNVDTARVDTIAKAENSDIDIDSIPTLYDFALFANDGNIVISHYAENPAKTNHFPDKWGVIDTSGKVIIDGKKTWLIPSYTDRGKMLFPNNAGYICFMKEGKDMVGILDKNYNVHISPKYKELKLFGEYAVITEDAKPGMDILYIPSKKIEGHIKDIYEIEDINEDMVLAINDKQQKCFLDLHGNIVIPPSKLKNYQKIYGFVDGRAAIENNNGKVGFIDKKGNIVIPPIYDYNYDLVDNPNFHDATAILIKNGKWGVIDKNGKIIIPFAYSAISRDHNSGYVNYIEDYRNDDAKIFRFDKNGKKIGKYITTKNPDEWEIYRDKETGNEGFINSEGKEMLPANYRMPSHFKNGYALVYIKNEQVCLIDSKGRIVLKRLARRNEAMLPG